MWSFTAGHIRGFTGWKEEATKNRSRPWEWMGWNGTQMSLRDVSCEKKLRAFFFKQGWRPQIIYGCFLKWGYPKMDGL